MRQAFPLTCALYLLCFFLCLSNGFSLSQDSVGNDLSTESLFLSSVQSHVDWQEFEVQFASIYLSYNMSMPLNSTSCDGVNLFVFVLSRPETFKIRDAIRNSWAKNPPHGTIVRFVLGRPLNTKLWSRMLDEMEKNRDLILYDIEDQYLHLPYKVHAAFQWQQTYCADAKFIAKVDDDNVLDLNRLYYWIEKKFAPLQLQHPSILFGYIRPTKAIRNKSSKYYVSEKVYPDEFYPAYASGPFYLLSNEAVTDILSHTADENYNPMEDVLFTGIVAERAMVHKENIWRHLGIWAPSFNKVECDPNEHVPLLFSQVGRGYKTPEAIQRKYQVFRVINCTAEEEKKTEAAKKTA